MRYRLACIFLGSFGLLLAVGGAAELIKKGSVAVIRSDEMEVDWSTGVTEMTGNVKVTITGDYMATMTAASVILTGDLEKTRILSIEARGPVNFVVDAKNKDGKPVHITARCSQQATFSEQTMLATMVGDAHAEMTGAVGAATSVESFRYDGQSVTIDLKNRKIRVKGASTEVRLAPEPTKPEAAQGNP